MSALAVRLFERLKSRRARVGVVGLGYVGLPLAVEFARSGFNTTGIDLDERKVATGTAVDRVGDARAGRQPYQLRNKPYRLSAAAKGAWPNN